MPVSYIYAVLLVGVTLFMLLYLDRRYSGQDVLMLLVVSVLLRQVLMAVLEQYEQPTAFESRSSLQMLEGEPEF